jgi:hypothetical protein
MREIAREQWGATIEKWHMPEALAQVAEGLRASKYSQATYNQKK